MSIGIKFPIERTLDGGVFESTKTTEKALRTNLIFLLTLKKGHRVMRSNLYSPLYDYIMEPFDENTEDLLTEDLNDKIKDYIPQITITGIEMKLREDLENTVSIKITYTINVLGGIQDFVTVILPTQEN